MKTIILVNTDARGYYIPERRKLLYAFAKKQRAALILLGGKGEIFDPALPSIKNADRIFIAGGDGTFDAALNYEPLYNKTIGFFPLGLGNQIYWYVYGDKHFDFLSKKINFVEEKIDVLKLHWNDKERNCLSASVGLDAEVMRLTHRTKGHPFYDYVIAIIKAAFFGKSRFSIDVSTKEYTKSFSFVQVVSIGKIPHYGYGIRAISEEILPQDGTIYGTVIRSIRNVLSAKIYRVLSLIDIHKKRKTKRWESIKSKTLTLSSKQAFPLQAGGEYLGISKKVSIQIKRKQNILKIKK